MTKADEALVFQAAALVLTYPEAELLTRLDTIEAALARTEAAQPFSAVLAHLRRRTLSQLQSFHIQEFDLSRRHALHLSYWTDGDTRRRGEVLAEIKQVYRESGLLVATGGELPDYLPMVLEFAVADPERGVGLLQRFRASLELLRLGLAKDGLPHAGVLTAVCDCLPGESPRTHAEVQARYGEIRPVEFVGLDSVESLLQRSPASGAFGPGGQPAADGLSASPAGDPASPAGHPASLAGHPASLAGDPASLAGDPASPAGHPASPTGHPASPAGDPASLAGDPASPAGHPASPTRHPRGGGDLVTSSRGGS